MRRVAVLALSLVLASLALSGCARAKAPEPATQQEAKSVTIEAMSPEQKQSLIATSFPMEVPVAVGKVARGEAQGPDAWDYELSVAAPLSDVETWYRQAYSSRNWQLSERTQGAGLLSLTFVKGAAQSRVDLSEKGASTTVSVILGVGAPVLQTQ